MRLPLLLILGSMFVCTTSSIFAEESVPLPDAAQSVLEKLEKSEDKLNKAHTKSVNAERGKAINDLQKVLKDVTKTGDLTTALAVKKQIDELTAKIEASESTDLLGNQKEIDYGKILAGSWDFQKNNGTSGVIEIAATGELTAKVTRPFPITIPGKWEVDKKTGVVKLMWVSDPNRSELLTFSPPDKLSGDSFDAGKNGFHATRKK